MHMSKKHMAWVCVANEMHCLCIGHVNDLRHTKATFLPLSTGSLCYKLLSV